MNQETRAKTPIMIKNLQKTFGEKTVLHHFSHTFPYGKITAVMGASGSGKTTLLRLIAGLETANSGEISGVPDRISFVFQENRLCPDFNALGNIRAVVGNTVPKNEILHHLDLLGLSDSLSKPVKLLSGGMKRRVALAKAILFNGDLFLLDEPFSGLDDILKESVMDYIQEYTRGKTVIMITHDEREAEYLGADVLTIYKNAGDIK